MDKNIYNKYDQSKVPFADSLSKFLRQYHAT